jgi:PAS domain S-box-containing protein
MKSLRTQLLIAFIGTQAAIVAALLAAGYFIFSGQRTELAKDTGDKYALALSSAAAPLLVRKDYAALRELVALSAESAQLAYVQVQDFDGRTVASWGEPRADDLALHFEAPIVFGGQPYGRLTGALTGKMLRAAQERLATMAFVLGSIGIALSALLAVLLSRAMTRRLSMLASATTRIGAGRFDFRLPLAGDDEVAQLARAMDSMSAALAKREAVLRDNEVRLRTIIESLAEGVILRDAGGKAVLFNEAARLILGCTREQMQAASFEAMPWRVLDATGQPLPIEQYPSARVQRSQMPAAGEILHIERPDGSRVWIEVNTVPFLLDEDDSPRGTVSSFVDVTQRLEARRALESMNAELEQRVKERTQELVTALDAAERASRAKSEFLSRMSHELRTPLNAILGFAQILQLKADALPAPARDQLRQIETAGWHLLELINEVLDLSRIESGTVTVSREPVAVAPLVTECVRMAEPLARRHGVQLASRADDAAGLHALGDRTRLRQVVTNLLSNAIKYNRPGGTATVAVTHAAEGRIEIAVADTGRGFTQQQLEQLFQPFNRLGAERGPVEGTGIGLVITRRLVELMGGTLDVATTAGAGSVFTVRLPAAQGGAAAVPAPASVQPAPATDGARTVLYIEDNPSNVELLASVLALRPGLQLVTAANGADGLALARSRRPDLIVVDVALPDIDGFEVCRRLRADAAFARAPIVALSANAMPADIAKGRAAGFNAYLTKPLDVPAFLAELDRWLGQVERPR